jgi:hypothetical protein
LLVVGVYYYLESTGALQHRQGGSYYSAPYYNGDRY